MKSIHKYILAGAGMVAMAAIVWGAYALGQHQADSRMHEMTEQIDSLRQGEKDAAVVRRVSQQMEEIAYQQKDISDKQRARAEEQSALAVANAQRAEQESRAAREAEGRALQSAKEAEMQRANAEEQQQNAERQEQIALQQRNEATRSKNIADTLNYRAVARTLGITSMQERSRGNHELADLLAYASWNFNTRYKGNEYVSESFKALSQATSQNLSLTLHKRGAVNALATVPGKKAASECVAVSDYGEVELITSNGKTLKSSVLLQNKNYDFHAVWTNEQNIYALSSEGTLCILGYQGGLRTVTLPAGKYKHLIPLSAKTLLAVAERKIVTYSLTDGQVKLLAELPKTLSTAGKRADVVSLFYADGTYAEMNEKGTVTEQKALVSGVVTSAHYAKDLDCFYLGTKNGNVYPVNRYNRPLERLANHEVKVTDMATVGSVLVTGAYDKSVNIWQMDNLWFDSGLNFRQELNARTVKPKQVKNNSVSKGWITPVSYDYDGWVLSLEPATDGHSIWIGSSSGRVTMIDVSVGHMAQVLKKKLKRSMTQAEWNHYVGDNIPYVSFSGN